MGSLRDAFDLLRAVGDAWRTGDTYLRFGMLLVPGSFVAGLALGWGIRTWL